jgi:metal-responsive CopG/Arc/MetJ family transcriptional regulator
MKNIKRITVVLDDDVKNILGKMNKEKTVSRSELLRQALRFYSENEKLIEV